MAQTIKTYVSDGSTTIYTFEFEYINKDYVKVLVNGVEVGRTLSGTYQVTLDATPNAGDVVVVKRTTASDRIVQFSDGSILVAKDLNISALQAIHIAEEALSAASGSLLIDQTGAFSAGNRRIANVGLPVEPTDAVTKEWVETTGPLFVVQSTALKNETAALKAATEAARDVTLSYKADAQTAKTNSETAQAASEAARDLSLTLADITATHKDAAQVARTGAEAALTASQTIQTDIGDLRTDGAALIAEATRLEGLTGDHEAAALASAAAAALSAHEAALAASFDPADYALAVHGHNITDITSLQATLDGKSATGHTHSIANVVGLTAELNSKLTTSAASATYALVAHAHTISDVTGLQSALNGKAATSHSHTIANVTGLQTSLDSKVNNSRITIAASDPSGGVDGDLWFKV